ncbi:MAG: SusC/RagA family TonB-linked outer membrane protein [Chitinophagaceae bacterium]|nr:SusC/RagA family TonB-linked outer membrane protein [Chitinophagaceae bacterium]
MIFSVNDKYPPKWRISRQFLKFMKLTAIFLTVAFLQVHAKSFPQVTLSLKNVPVEKVFIEIERQAGYGFLYTKTVLSGLPKVTIEVRNVSVDEVLNECFKGQPMEYSIENNMIVIKRKITANLTSTAEIKDITEPPVQISGQVLNQDREPLSNVSVTIVGSKTGTTTNSEGRFTLDAPDNKNLVLEFSSIGYKTKRVNTGTQNLVEVVLELDVAGLSDVVVVGYGTQRKVDVTGAIDVIKIDELNRNTASNPLTGLQGQSPGVFVSVSGRPGSNPDIIIRGLSTLGNNAPLYIIDGIPTESGLENIQASNIESIQILKDAAAASIYGSRASNGVIIVETKKGNSTLLTFESRITSQKYLNGIKVLNTEQRGRVLWQASINEGKDPNAQPLYDYEWSYDNNGNPVLEKVIPITWINEDMGIKGADTDWYKEVTRPGLILTNQLTLSTNGKSGGGRLSVTHYKDKGVFIYNNFSKLNIDLNSHYRFKENIEVGQSIILNSSTDYPDNVRGDALTQQPLVPVHTTSGGWGGPWGAGFEDWMQPVMNATINSWDNTKRLSVFGSGYLSIKFLKDFTFKSNVGIEYINSVFTDYQRPYEAGFLHRNLGSLGINNSTTLNWSLSNTLTYNLKRGNHAINVLAGTDLYKNTTNFLNTFAQDFAVDQRDYYQMNSAVGTKTISGNGSGYQLLSFFGKVNYNFLNRYLLSTTLRYDGSSRFGKDNRFGLFPSFSLGWRMDEEKFIRELNVFDLLKPRFGYGVVGNQKIQNDAAIGLYEALYGIDYTWIWDPSTSYDINGSDGGNLASGFHRVKSGNSHLKWETTTENNFGFDFGILNMLISGSFDYYIRKSKDILIQPPYLGAIGEGGTTWYNGASVSNKGWELSLNYKKSVNLFTYGITLNLGHFKDKITYLPEDVVKAYPGNVEKTILGRSQREMFGYVADGLFQNQQEVDDHAAQTGKGIGRIRYKDLNKDGVINALDQEYLGNTLPGIIYGIGFNIIYKQWSLNIFANGEGSKNVYNSVKQNTDFIFARAGINYGTRVLDAWTPQNNTSTIPALKTTNENNEYRSSTYFVESGSYFKLRNVEVNYTFKDGLQFFNRLRLFLIGENLVAVKPRSYTGPDPESPNNAYGRPRKVTFGVNFSL